MSENRREQIKTNLLTHDTEYLLGIWQNGDADEWEKEVFEIIKEILLDRLGYVPPQSVEKQVSKILDRVEDYLESEEFDKALRECEIAINSEFPILRLHTIILAKSMTRWGNLKMQ